MEKLHFKNFQLDFRRKKSTKGFSFVDKKGKAVSKKDQERIASLGIPPAWKEVEISSDPLSHIQAVGKDAKGRKQYIYHPTLVKHNQKHKFESMVDFGRALPFLREAVSGHMRDPQLSRNRVLATIVWLLEHTFIRVGNRVYAEENNSYGLTTMRNKHVDLARSKVTFSFVGKSGVYHELDVTHPKVVRTIKECFDLPGYELFQYVDEGKVRQTVDAADVNDYLQSYAGNDFSAKDFRTWGGSVLAGESFYKKGEAEENDLLKKNISEVIGEVSKHLRNTKEVCRKYYVHPTIIKTYEKKVLVPHFAHVLKRGKKEKLGLLPKEYAMWSLIKDN